MNNEIIKNMSMLVFKLGLEENKDHIIIKLNINSYRSLWYQLLGNGRKELTNEHLRSLHSDMDNFKEMFEFIQGKLIANAIRDNRFGVANSLINSSEKIKVTVNELNDLLNDVDVEYWEGTK